MHAELNLCMRHNFYYMKMHRDMHVNRHYENKVQLEEKTRTKWQASRGTNNKCNTKYILRVHTYHIHCFSYIYTSRLQEMAHSSHIISYIVCLHTHQRCAFVNRLNARCLCLCCQTMNEIDFCQRYANSGKTNQREKTKQNETKSSKLHRNTWLKQNRTLKIR